MKAEWAGKPPAHSFPFPPKQEKKGNTMIDLIIALLLLSNMRGQAETPPPPSVQQRAAVCEVYAVSLAVSLGSKEHVDFQPLAQRGIPAITNGEVAKLPSGDGCRLALAQNIGIDGRAVEIRGKAPKGWWVVWRS